ncbi:MAG TPA: DUF1638 domain-containing protein [Anaerolineae bacterium]|nr:DUF1638 domain-containing protein [Anaerolineae bacterium]
MRIKCLACEALARVVYLCAAHSPHIVDVELFRIGLHREPADLRARLQARIDAVNQEGLSLPSHVRSTQCMAQGKLSSTGEADAHSGWPNPSGFAAYDAIAMVYGLCGQSTAGLIARDVPLVIPRAHDCITLFLGDRRRYGEAFREQPGTYWYALDYAERSDGSMALGAEADAGESGFEVQDAYREYVEKYGQDNADYLMEVMGAWQKHYSRASLIEMGVGDSTRVEARARALAEQRGWAFQRVEGDLVLIRRLLDGEWASGSGSGDDFLIVPPGQQVRMTYDIDVIGCAPVTG